MSQEKVVALAVHLIKEVPGLALRLWQLIDVHMHNI